MAEDKEILISIKVDNTEAQKRIDKQTEAILDLKKANELLKKANKETKNGDKLSNDQRIRNEQQIAKNTIKIQQATQVRKKAINSQKSEVGSLNNLRNTLATLTAARNKNTVVGSKAFNKANTDINKLTTTIKKAEQGGDDFRRSVGKYPQVMGQATSAIGGFNLALLASPIGLITAAIGALVAVGRQAFNFFKTYEVVMSKVKAVTQATTEETNRLRASTIEFGESTKFTATQVGQLQLELAKLGKSTDEIIDMTGAILDLAVATDSELGDTAAIVAKTLNQFGLEAADTTRVTDVMAQSFVSSALDITKFEEAMKKAGPIARLSGKSFEETTAIVASLADAGVDASNIGTSLRDVFSDLAKSGETWDSALSRIKNSTDRVKTANEIFGKTSLTVTALLAENIDRVDELTHSLNNAEGAASAMAEIVGNNLQGDLDRLGSSWEGLIARGGFLNTIFRLIIINIKQFVDDLKGLPIEFERLGLIITSLFRNIAISVTEYFSDIVVSIGKSIVDFASKVGYEIKGLNKSIEDNVGSVLGNVSKLKEGQEKDAKRITEINKIMNDKLASQQKEIANVFKEEEDAKTAATFKSYEKRIKITDLENKKAKKAAQKKLDEANELATRIREAEFNLLIAKKEAAAEDITNAQDKAFALTEIEKLRLAEQLSDETLLSADIELLKFESGERIAQFRENAALQESDRKKRQASEDEKLAKEEINRQKQVANAKMSLVNSAFELAKTVGAKDEKVQKALAIAQVIKNTAIGVSKAFTLLPPASYIQAAAVGISGASSLASIASSSSGGGGASAPSAPSGGGGSSTPIADTSQADNALSQQSALEDAISNLGLTVSVTEINDAQNNVQLSEANSTI